MVQKTPGIRIIQMVAKHANKLRSEFTDATALSASQIRAETYRSQDRYGGRYIVSPLHETYRLATLGTLADPMGIVPQDEVILSQISGKPTRELTPAEIRTIYLSLVLLRTFAECEKRSSAVLPASDKSMYAFAGELLSILQETPDIEPDKALENVLISHNLPARHLRLVD